MVMKGVNLYERSRTKNHHHLPRFLLIIVVVVFSSIVLVWYWEKAPTLFPSHAQLLNLFPDVKVKQVTTDLREAQGVANNISPPNITSSSFHISNTAHENTTDIVKQSVPSHVSENHSDAKPPKHQIVEPVAPNKLDATVERQGDMSNVENQACNYGKGRWVKDDSQPLYSGFGCKQWLSGMWACRLTQRTDFGYEKLKWQPKDCKMDDFTGPNFLKRYSVIPLIVFALMLESLHKRCYNGGFINPNQIGGFA